MGNVFDFGYAIEILPRLLEAAIITVQATFLGFGLALVVGLVIAILRMAPYRTITVPVGLATEAIRSTPILMQLFIVWFIIVPAMGLQRAEIVIVPGVLEIGAALAAGIVTLGIHYGTYCSEVYRSGIEGVPRGQWEAATALNMTPSLAWRRIIIPQAIPPIIPALGNYLIALFKETPVLFTITVIELFGEAMQIGGEQFRFFEPVLLVGLIFLAVSLPSAWAVKRIEKRLAARPGAQA